ncbi:MAG: TlpA family protein disulfide reductase [Acidimicrobiia bacterium]
MSRNAKVANSKKRAERERRTQRARRRRRARNIGIGGAAIATVALVAMLSWPEPDVGSTTAEAWDLPALDGESRHAISDFDGKPTVAAFFASWCHVCEREMPDFLAVSNDLEGLVNFVGINSQDGGRGIADAEKWGIAGSWPIARDIGGNNGSGLSIGSFGARGMPLTVIYSANGEVAHIQRGGISGTGLRAILNDLFGV